VAKFANLATSQNLLNKKKKKHHWCCGSLWPFESKQAMLCMSKANEEMKKRVG
jgi:hypothetical protein